jgi:hypothetical protein
MTGNAAFIPMDGEDPAEGNDVEVGCWPAMLSVHRLAPCEGSLKEGRPRGFERT